MDTFDLINLLPILAGGDSPSSMHPQSSDSPLPTSFLVDDPTISDLILVDLEHSGGSVSKFFCVIA
ncbi:hypothetical protein PHLCEN_2v3340 [Hermanssonia centrifuga]|uniref:Pheromone n=1 Tax=Hermanssonia centrifuga TaxID=98765 RepID=A0A2R6QMB6_9APHY|nr:hypothetical protein PHLCEN_2v3340 [Hermanssonia centrifuga]